MTEHDRQTGADVTGSAPRRLMPRPGRGLSFEKAMQRSMRRHRDVYAALAESERRDREAEAGAANIRRGLAE